MAVTTHTQLVHLRAVTAPGGLHPELVRRFLALGLVDPGDPDAEEHLERAMRLRHDLGIGYAGAILAVQLLDRIDELEARLRRYER
jgi:chaperone modulatory protein CbpM